jgi:hypothetical protein
MSKRIHISRQTRKNWLIDAAVLVGAVVAALSGIYFLFLPSGGYQGGRNPAYGLTVLFSRHTWDDLHTWGGMLMVAAVAIHFAIHWQWVKMMGKRVVSSLRGGGSRLSRGSAFNVTIDATVAISFVLCALSGIYFLLAPASGAHVSAASLSQNLFFSRSTWDLIHTWSGTLLIVSAIVHLAIHWRWVKNVTIKFFLSLPPQAQADPQAVLG